MQFDGICYIFNIVYNTLYMRFIAMKWGYSVKKIKALLSLLCALLCICTVLCSCSDSGDASASSTASATTEAVEGTTSKLLRSKIGSGKFTFVLEITDASGVTVSFDVGTDKNTVGEALTSIGMISGEQGDFGLYVKTVNGITADYDTDGSYWAFYVNGELAPQGVDQTYVKNGYVYTFKVEK